MNRRVLRSVFAVLVGWAVVISGYFATVIIIAIFNPERFQPDVRPSTGWLLITLLIASVWAVIAGFVTGAIARKDELKHAIGLVLLTLAISVFWRFIGTETSQVSAWYPHWYRAAGVILEIPTTLLGAWLRMKQRVLLEMKSKAMIRATDIARFPMAVAASLAVFLVVMCMGFLLGGSRLWSALKGVLDERYRPPVSLGVFAVCLVLAFILSRLVFRWINPTVSDGLMTDVAGSCRE